ncbi:MAG TPA: efflux RND transporter periplasmic adaptor subunit [Woeseiaceae bacterium]|nr:efflux RND transporter periplasmic adaptor subunit [Woeseiaceae bacterium]
MPPAKLQEYKSWLFAASVVALVGIWILSGQVFPSRSDEVSSRISDDAPQDGSSARNTVRVRTQTAEKIQRTIVVNGKTAPARVVELAAETDGRIEFIGAERGSNVRQGEVIVQLDERDRRARLAEASATVRQREVEHEARNKLKSSSYVSEAQLTEAFAALEAARAELTRARLDLARTVIRAPFDGALQARQVEIGDFVKAGDKVATYVDNRKIVVSGNLSEFDAGFISVGEQAEAELATGETVFGHVRYIAPVADEATRTFAIELEVDNSAGKLRAGGTAELRLPAETVLAHRLSPSLLTLDDAGTVGIKIIDDEGAVQFVPADIALSTSDGVWVAGLPVTATIITVGQGFVSSGSVVNAVPEGDINTAFAIKSH